jgi:hypothetical protein
MRLSLVFRARISSSALSIACVCSLPTITKAQTLTPQRGLFSFADSIRRNTLRMREVAADSLIIGLNVDAALRTYLNSTPATRPNLTGGGAAIQVASYSANLVLAVNIGSTADTIISDYGTSLLQPLTLAASGHGKGVLVDYRKLFLNKPGKFPYSRGGMHFYFSGSGTTWRLPTGNGASTTIDGNVTGLGLQASAELLNVYISSTPLSALLDFGPVYRHLGGNLSNPANASVVTQALSTSARDFAGLEGDVTLHISDVHIGIGAYYIGGSVLGLSGIEYGAGISAGASFLSGRTVQSGQTVRAAF